MLPLPVPLHSRCYRVSILTRAEARVLPPTFVDSCFSTHVSILTRAEARVLLAQLCDAYAHNRVSILTRAEARVLHLKTANGRISYRKFQSSPAPRRGCCQLWAGYGLTPGGVSILTRAEARVLQ